MLRQTAALPIALHPLDTPATADLGRAAVRALYEELALAPKPGLVSPLDSGSHSDMTVQTFLRSLFALRSYFRDIAAAGDDGPPSVDPRRPPRQARAPARRGKAPPVHHRLETLRQTPVASP